MICLREHYRPCSNLTTGRVAVARMTTPEHIIRAVSMEPTSPAEALTDRRDTKQDRQARDRRSVLVASCGCGYNSSTIKRGVRSILYRRVSLRPDPMS